MSIIIPQDVPVYKILEEQGFFDGVELHPEGSIIVWTEEPSEEMEPLNDLATKAAYAFSEKLDEFHEEFRKTEEGKKEPRRKRPDWQLKRSQDGVKRTINLSRPSEGVPLLPSKSLNSRRRATKIEDETENKKVKHVG